MADYEIINGRVVPKRPTFGKKEAETKGASVKTENRLKGETNAATHTDVPPAQFGNLGTTPGDLSKMAGVYDLVAKLRDTFKPEYYGGVNNIPGVPTLQRFLSERGFSGGPERAIHENIRQAFVNQKTEAQKGTQTEGDIRRLWEQMAPPSGSPEFAKQIIGRDVGQAARGGASAFKILQGGGYDTPQVVGAVSPVQGPDMSSRMFRDAQTYGQSEGMAPWSKPYPPTYGPVEVSNVVKKQRPTPIMQDLSTAWDQAMGGQQADPEAAMLQQVQAELQRRQGAR